MNTRDVMDHAHLLELVDSNSGARFVLHLDPVQQAGGASSLAAGLLFRSVENPGRGRPPVWRLVPREGPTYRTILNNQRHLDARVAELQSITKDKP